MCHHVAAAHLITASLSINSTVVMADPHRQRHPFTWLTVYAHVGSHLACQMAAAGWNAGGSLPRRNQTVFSITVD